MKSAPLSYNQQLQAHTPSIGPHTMTYHGGMGHPNTVTDMLGKQIEPPRLGGNAPYLSRFVAGPARLESNPLSEPLRNFKVGNSPPK